MKNPLILSQKGNVTKVNFSGRATLEVNYSTGKITGLGHAKVLSAEEFEEMKERYENQEWVKKPSEIPW